VLPPRLRTSLLGLVLLAIGATLATVVFEVTWYGLVNNIDPARILAANIDPDLAPRPAQKVLITSVAVIVLVAARRGAAAANRLWTKRYIQRTIPTS
jgi:sulfoxide reductase heme-binding subunit YedZ